mmetsp:Transcript_8301/g.31240  ORF Transcript_8301/g.31240 Transcript_8301/m.31240 type:complete len:240 (-) Transcript_8301:66-785(-)
MERAVEVVVAVFLPGAELPKVFRRARNDIREDLEDDAERALLSDPKLHEHPGIVFAPRRVQRHPIARVDAALAIDREVHHRQHRHDQEHVIILEEVQRRTRRIDLDHLHLEDQHAARPDVLALGLVPIGKLGRQEQLPLVALSHLLHGYSPALDELLWGEQRRLGPLVGAVEDRAVDESAFVVAKRLVRGARALAGLVSSLENSVEEAGRVLHHVLFLRFGLQPALSFGGRARMRYGRA